MMHTEPSCRTLAAVILVFAGAAVLASTPAAGQARPSCDVVACAATTLVTPALLAPPLLVPLAAEAAHAPRPQAFDTGLASYGLAQVRDRDRRWEGAALGFAVGAAATWFVLYQGGSTGPCNRRENQDAWSAGQCAAAAAAGGLVLAPVGYYIGSRIRVGSRRT